MYLVKTYLDYSAIHGIGVFAGEDIAEGAVVWQTIEGLDRAIDPAVVENYPEAGKQFVRTYGYLFKGKWWLCSDHGMFSNHDDNPNTLGRDDVSDIAVRAIKKGEEITCNYRQFDSAVAEKLGS